MSLNIIKGGNNSGDSPQTATVTGSIGPGQVMLAFVQDGTIPTSTTVADNVNAGNYSLLASFPAQNLAIYWIITNALNSGSTIITLTNGVFFVYIWTAAITGFLGTPTADTGINATATGTSTTPTIAAASNFANEIMLVHSGIQYTQSLSASGWTSASTDTGFGPFYAIEATPTTNNFNGTWGTSQAWALQLAGVYDAPAVNSASIAWVS
jgi:hypothetical protein